MIIVDVKILTSRKQHLMLSIKSTFNFFEIGAKKEKCRANINKLIYIGTTKVKY